jgi:hypothetical protein
MLYLDGMGLVTRCGSGYTALQFWAVCYWFLRYLGEVKIWGLSTDLGRWWYFLCGNDGVA